MTVVGTEPLLVEDVLLPLAVDAVTTRLAGTSDVTEIMTDGTVTVTASASVIATDLAALMNVTETVTATSRTTVTDTKTASVVMTSATLPQTVTTEKVSSSLICSIAELYFDLNANSLQNQPSSPSHQVTMNSTQPSKSDARKMSFCHGCSVGVPTTSTSSLSLS